MTKISGATSYHKRVFPALWFGFLVVFLFISILTKAPLLFLAGPVAMAVFGFVLFRRLVWDLADEVYDAGDHLVFRKGGLEQIVRLDEIVNIDSMQMSSPERISVLLRSPGPIGEELVFTPKAMGFRWTRKNPIATDLIERVDRARSA